MPKVVETIKKELASIPKQIETKVIIRQISKRELDAEHLEREEITVR